MTKQQTVSRIDFEKQISILGSIFLNNETERPVTSFQLSQAESLLLKTWLESSKEAERAISTLQSVAEDNEGNALLHMWFNDLADTTNPFQGHQDNSLLKKLFTLTEIWKQIGITGLSFEFYKLNIEQKLSVNELVLEIDWLLQNFPGIYHPSLGTIRNEYGFRLRKILFESDDKTASLIVHRCILGEMNERGFSIEKLKEYWAETDGKTRYRIEFVSHSDGYSSFVINYFDRNTNRWEPQAFSNYSTLIEAKNALIDLEVTKEVLLKHKIGKTRYRVEFVRYSDGYTSFVINYFDRNTNRWEPQAFSKYSNLAEAKNALLDLEIQVKHKIAKL